MGNIGNQVQDNPYYCVEIFGEFKSQKVDKKITKTKDISQKISQGELPVLSASNINSGNPIYLAWYAKIMYVCVDLTSRSTSLAYTKICRWLWLLL